VKLKVAHSDHLASLPASIGALLKLQHLAASHCKLMDVPQGLCQCTALKTLDLSFNKLAGIDFEACDWNCLCALVL